MFRYWLVFLTISMSVVCVFDAAGDEHSFQLDWQKEGFHTTLGVDMDRVGPFTKEPDFAQREVLRGMLEIGHPEQTEQVGFAWDKLEGKLYVDLNRDGDLTNDSDGVLTSDGERSGQYVNQSFSEFQLSLKTDSGRHDYQLSVQLSDYPWGKSANYSIRSGYQGNVQLYGKKWHFQVVDPLRGKVELRDSLSIWPEAEECTNRFDSLPMPESVFLHDHCYAINFEFKPGEGQSPRLWCRLTEKDVPLSSLRVEGENINQFVFGDGVALTNGGRNGTVSDTGNMLILPRLSDDVMTVPVGEYPCRQLSLKPNNMPPASPQNINGITVKVAADADNVLKVGAPLNHQVKIERSGRMLKFDYELVGAGGEMYDFRAITGYDNDSKPAVTIYKGDMQLATGEFEFG